MFIMLHSFNRLFSGGNKTDDVVDESFDEEEIVHINIEEVVPNQYQPRTVFDEEKINELAQTLRTHGMIQPIVVRKLAEKQYELIAGERRLRAAKQLEWKTIPAIIRTLTDTETASIALIENIQREQLTVIEEAHAYKKLIQLHSLTQEALAQRLGKSQSTIANRLRLLNLPAQVQDALLNKKILERHARALMKLKEEDEQLQFLQRIIDEGLNVRETDELINDYLKGEKPKRVSRQRQWVSKDIRIATNTIKRSLQMISEAGIDVEAEEEDLDEFYQVTIRIKKRE